jgi:hypothetical protein
MKGSNSTQITRPEAIEALVRSGYLLESRLESRLQRAGYYVEANHTYPDPDTGKSREFDLYAMGAVRAGANERDFIFQVLLIEWVNNPQPLVLVTKPPQVPFLHHLDAKLAGLPVKFPVKGGGWSSLPDYLGLDKFHHYCRGRIATQFCSFRLKKEHHQREWMALHEDAHFDSFRKLCAVTDYFVDQHFKSWLSGGFEPVNIEFYYPVLVVSGPLLEARPRGSSVILSRRQHLQFRRSELTRGEPENYQIDVTTEAYLPRLLSLIEREAQTIATRLKRRGKEVRTAVERIVRSAKRLRSPEKIKKAFEF